MGQFLPQWTKAIASPFILDLIKDGYKLELTSRPHGNFMVTQPPKDKAKAEALFLSLAELVDQRVLIQVPLEEQGQGVYSHVFIVRKPSGKFRMILNLRPLNKFVKYKRFRMESIFTVARCLFPGCYMATLDLRDAYLHIPIHPDFQKFLRVAVRIDSRILHYQFQALPFGLSSSPSIFTKVLAEALAPLRDKAITVIPYLDDLLFVAATALQLEKDLRTAQDFLSSLGWIINQDKSHLVPSQEVVYLGYRISSIKRKIFLPEEKIAKLDQAVAQLQSNLLTSVREVMRVLGLMTSCFPAVPWARFHQRPLQELMLRLWSGQRQDLESQILVSHKVKRMLWWWRSPRNLDRGLDWTFPVEVVVTTDASAWGWGAHLEEAVAQGAWSPVEASRSSNQRELLAILRTIESFQGRLAGKHLQVRTDNAAAVAYVNKQGGTRSPALQGDIQQDPILGGDKPVLDNSGPSKGHAKFSGRLPKSSTSEAGRVVPKRGGILSDNAKVGSSRDRSLCLRKEQEGNPILLNSSKRPGPEDRCLLQSLEVQPLLRLPSSKDDSGSTSKISVRKDRLNSGHTLLAKETLVCNPGETERSPSIPSSNPERSDFTGSNSTPAGRQTKPDCVVSEEQLLREQGLSDRVVKTLLPVSYTHLTLPTKLAV